MDKIAPAGPFPTRAIFVLYPILYKYIKEKGISRTEAVLAKINKYSKKDQHKVGPFLAAPVRLELTTHGLTELPIRFLQTLQPFI